MYEMGEGTWKYQSYHTLHNETNCGESDLDIITSKKGEEKRSLELGFIIQLQCSIDNFANCHYS